MQKWKKQKNQTQGKWYCLRLIFLFMQNFALYSIFIIFKQVNGFFKKRKKSFFSSKIICYRHNFHPICSKIDMDHGHDVAYGDGEQEVCQMKYRNSKLNKILTSQNQAISFVILFFSNSVALLPNHGQKSMEKNTYKYPRMYWLTVATIEPIANHFEYPLIAKKRLLKKIVHFFCISGRFPAYIFHSSIH